MFEDKQRQSNLANKQNSNDQLIEEEIKKEEIIINEEVYNALLK
jgi:hypothetical protein